MMLHRFPDTETLGQHAATYVTELATHAIVNRRRFTVAFSGGSLPKILCPPLVARESNWANWHVFFADERCVPLDDPASNYALLRAQLFEHVDIPAAQIYPWAADANTPPAAAAAAYQAKIAAVLRPADYELPQFDLILLGMGEDGHTASLFPGHPLLDKPGGWVAAITDSPKPPPNRITLTLPVINRARHVMFITTGAGKAETLAQVIATAPTEVGLPARRVYPESGQLHWYVDDSAAQLIDQ